MMRRLLTLAVFTLSFGLSTAGLAQQPPPDEPQEQQDEPQTQRDDPPDQPEPGEQLAQEDPPEGDQAEQEDDRDDENVPRSLFDEGFVFDDIEFTGFGGPEIRFGEITGNVGTFVGGRAGIIIQDIFVLGGAGYGMTNSPENAPLINGEAPAIGMGYGGALFEWLIYPEHILHAGLGGVLGVGNVSYQLQSETILGREADSLFLVADLFGAVELNVTRFLRVATGIGYRFTTGASLPGLDDSDISSPTAHVIIKLGKFD